MCVHPTSPPQIPLANAETHDRLRLNWLVNPVWSEQMTGETGTIKEMSDDDAKLYRAKQNTRALGNMFGLPSEEERASQVEAQQRLENRQFALSVVSLMTDLCRRDEGRLLTTKAIAYLTSQIPDVVHDCIDKDFPPSDTIVSTPEGQ